MSRLSEEFKEEFCSAYKRYMKRVYYKRSRSKYLAYQKKYTDKVRKRGDFTCSVCNKALSGYTTYNTHLKTKKHLLKKELEDLKSQR